MYKYDLDKAYGYDGIIVALKYAEYENATGSYVFRSWVIDTLGM